jgi:hypothetical protein
MGSRSVFIAADLLADFIEHGTKQRRSFWIKHERTPLGKIEDKTASQEAEFHLTLCDSL